MSASPTTAERHWTAEWKEKNKVTCNICGDRAWIPMDDERRIHLDFICPACKRADFIANKYRLVIIRNK